MPHDVNQLAWTATNSNDNDEDKSNSVSSNGSYKNEGTTRIASNNNSEAAKWKLTFSCIFEVFVLAVTSSCDLFEKLSPNQMHKKG